ncbi:MAG: DNA translocase FtsK [Treponema sp.]|nr:DNA translocase FtsK [Treponema sp.]
MIAAFFGAGTFLSAPGNFFGRSFGVLALVIPAYFLYAAFILADPRYQPERIFVLGSVVFPFFTLALGFFWLREFETLRHVSPFIARAGRVGIGFFAFFLVSFEILIIGLLRHLLFRGGSPAGQAPASAAVENPASPPAPAGTPDSPEPQEHTQDAKAKPQSLNQIYAEAAAAMSADDTAQAGMPVAQMPAARLGAVQPLVQQSPVPAEYEEFEDDYLPDEIDETDEADQASEAEDEDENDDSDVEKALAEASAFAAAIAEEGTVRHESRKSAADSAQDRALRERKRRQPYIVPVEGILKQYPDGEYWIVDEDTRNAAIILKETFKEFNIQVEVTGIRKGPVITMFEILPAPGIRLAKIEGLADNIALRLAAQSVRIVAPIPGKHAVGIEVPNVRRSIVSFREIIEGELSRDGKKAEIPVVLGKDITGEAVTVDLIQMPHLLIAGSTGSGKSVCVNSMILTLLYQKPPAECRLILIDPKIVELKLYNDIPHLLTPVITEPKKAFQALQYCICEMERRYACLDSMGVRDIRSYNKRIKERNIATEHMPYIVVVIDEFADLMATTGKELESTVARLAAMSRAVGIHLVLATQRPSIDVITGLIKANIPSRIAFMVASKMDSRIIIDMVGAEKLLGKGDMLYAGAVDPFPIRMQGAFVSEEEVERVVDYVKSLGEPDYIDDEIFFDDDDDGADQSLFSDGDDPLYEKALEVVMQQGKASASYIQRRLKIGYNRAARLVEIMEHNGVVGPAQGSRPRELLRGA